MDGGHQEAKVRPRGLILVDLDNAIENFMDRVTSLEEEATPEQIAAAILLIDCCRTAIAGLME